MSFGWLVIVIALSTHRLTRLVTRDAFPLSVRLREAIARRWGDESWQSYLSECDWCASMWVGGVLTGITAQVVDVPVPFLVWWTASGLTGLIAQREPE